MNKYTFKTSHIPIPLDYGLYKISKKRPADWELIHELLITNKNQLSCLRTPNEDENKWFSRIMASWSLGQLLEECLTNLLPTCTLNTVLCDLIEDYHPIKVSSTCKTLSFFISKNLELSDLIMKILKQEIEPNLF